MRRLPLLIGAVVLLLPGFGRAAFDPTCTATFSRIEGTIADLAGRPLERIRVDLFASTTMATNGASVFTDDQGHYSVCVNKLNYGLTYEVQASDPGQVYETKAQRVDLFTNLTTVQTVDFQLPFRLYLTLTPNAISNAIPGNVLATVHSTAPQSTAIRVTSDVLGDFTPGFVTKDPDPSMFNVWQISIPIPVSLKESEDGQGRPAPYFFSARGLDGQAVVTTTDRQPLVIDHTAPSIGGNGCGSSGNFRLFGSTGTNPSLRTTNPRPVVYVGVCDTISGVDFNSIALKVDGNPVFVTVSGVPSFYNVYFMPSAPLALGSHSFVYSIKDLAGNPQTSQPASIVIVDFGGAPPVISKPGPSPTHPGLGIPGFAFGFGFAGSYPQITCYITDPDGMFDIVPGSVSVRLFYGDVEKAHYDPNEPQGGNPADPNTGSWNQATGLFNMNYNYALGAALPGLYTVVASASDHGGNSATLTWQFILAVAA